MQNLLKSVAFIEWVVYINKMLKMTTVHSVLQAFAVSCKQRHAKELWWMQGFERYTTSWGLTMFFSSFQNVSRGGECDWACGVCGAHACICCSTCCTVPADYSMFTLNSTPLLYWSNGCSSLCCKHRVLEEDESVRYVYFCQTLSYSTLIVCDLMWRYGLTHLNSDLNIAYFTCSFWLTCNLGVRCVRFDPN